MKKNSNMDQYIHMYARVVLAYDKKVYPKPSTQIIGGESTRIDLSEYKLISRPPQIVLTVLV